MNFRRLFAFIEKRFREIGLRNTDTEELHRIFNRIIVHNPHIGVLSSGCMIESDYSDYGFTEEDAD